jgi:hypothetical protein
VISRARRLRQSSRQPRDQGPGPPDRRGTDNDERRVVRTGEVGTVAAGRGQSKVRPVDTPIASSTRQTLRISDANWQTQECAVLAQLSIPCWSRQQGKSSYPRMTAVSPCCTGERADHPRSISHLPARQPATPCPFAERNISASEAFFRTEETALGGRIC